MATRQAWSHKWIEIFHPHLMRGNMVMRGSSSSPKPPSPHNFGHFEDHQIFHKDTALTALSWSHSLKYSRQVNLTTSFWGLFRPRRAFIAPNSSYPLYHREYSDWYSIFLSDVSLLRSEGIWHLISVWGLIRPQGQKWVFTPIYLNWKKTGIIKVVNIKECH